MANNYDNLPDPFQQEETNNSSFEDDPLLLSSSLSLSRLLQMASSNRGRLVLTVLYVGVLCLCFMIPIFYYCRYKHDQRIAQYQREQEIRTIRSAMEQSQLHSESLCKQFNEERRARILQLFAQYRMTLREDHFPISKEHIMSQQEKDQHDDYNQSTVRKIHDIEQACPGTDHDDDDDDESVVVCIPRPGLWCDPNTTRTGMTTIVRENRHASGHCTICLSNFQVGSDIVWSSNSDCDHVFHVDCIEGWIMKQRNGSICPCCRREFIVDPLDNTMDCTDLSNIMPNYTTASNRS